MAILPRERSNETRIKRELGKRLIKSKHVASVSASVMPVNMLYGARCTRRVCTGGGAFNYETAIIFSEYPGQPGESPGCHFPLEGLRSTPAGVCFRYLTIISIISFDEAQLFFFVVLVLRQIQTFPNKEIQIRRKIICSRPLDLDKGGH